MRKIAFRAWDKDFKEMLYDFQDMRDWEMRWDKGRFSDIMQFTGLKDKNGKEIYEGDIIKLNSKNEWIHEIAFSNAAFRTTDFNYCIGDHEANDWTVIGNTMENPELLNG